MLTIAAADGHVLMLHETPEFTYLRERPGLIGITKSINCGHDKPLGLAAVKFWTRKKFDGTAALKKKINPTRAPIENKERIRGLDNLKQSTERLDDPRRCLLVHVHQRHSLPDGRGASEIPRQREPASARRGSGPSARAGRRSRAEPDRARAARPDPAGRCRRHCSRARALSLPRSPAVPAYNAVNSADDDSSALPHPGILVQANAVRATCL